MRWGWKQGAGVALGCVVASLSLSLSLSQCFAPTYADCAFRCGPQAPLCPDEYECRADGYCHLRGSTASCAFAPGSPGSIDLAPPQPDLGTAPVDAGPD